MRILLYKLFLLLLLVFISDETCAQWKVNTLPNQKQMPVGNVHQTMQDSDGYIWYATDGGGVCRDNGYQIDVIRKGLPSLQITRIDEDTAGVLWVGTLNGLCMIEKDKNFSVRPITREPFASSCIDALISTSCGITWVAAGNIIGCFDTAGRCIKCYRINDISRYAKYINSFYEDTKGHLWILETRGGLLKYDLLKQSFHRVLWNGYDPIEMVEDTLHKCFWIGTWNEGVVCLEENGKSRAVTPRFNALDVCISADCKTLFTTDMSMLRRWNINQDKTLDEDTSIKASLPEGRHILDKMDLDREGNIWVSSYMPHTFILSQDNDLSEITRLSDLGRQMLDESDLRLLPHNIIAEDDDLWIWQGRLGLVNYNKHNGILKCERVGAPAHLSRMEKCTQQKGIWLALGSSLCRAWRDGTVLHLEQAVLIPDNEHIYSIWDSSDGNVWIGTSRGIFRYIPDEKRILKIKNTDSEVLFLVTDSYGKPHALTASMTSLYSALSRGADGALWWGDINGNIYRQNSNDTLPVMLYCAAAGETINRICCDSTGHIWALTDQSISECNPETMAQRILSATDERLGIDFFRSICTSGKGVYIGAAGNVFKMSSSSSLNTVSRSIPPVISSLLCDSVMTLPDNETLEIPYSTKMIEIRMTTLDIMNAGNIRYAYRMRELGDKWIALPVGQNTIRLLLPSSGIYTLEARATDRLGVWSAAEEILVINKLPAWWQSRTAYVVYIIMLSVIIYISVVVSLSRHKRKQEQHIQEKLTELKFRFFTNISHELRTPLSLIITPLESLIRKGENDSLKPVLRQAEHLLDMINRLLDFRKLESGDVQLQLRTGNLTELLYMEVDALRPLAEKRSLTININVPDNDIYYTFDASKMHHIISNLISNAIKYNNVGGTVTVNLSQKEDSLISLSVSDTGIGIPQAEQSHIFERFYQASNLSGRTGSGIGLNMAREFVRQHGGELTFESVENRGTTFTVTLPFRVHEDSRQHLSLPADLSSVSATASVLLVEDNSEFREFLAQELSNSGYAVITAADGVEALHKIEENINTDIVVSDIMMPRMNGVDLCRKLKTDIKTSHIPVVLLTACADNDNMYEGYDAGADIYITKPFNIAILQNRIAYLLAQAEKRRQVFLKSVELKSEELADNDLDRQFIARAVSLVESNMNNTEYTVEAFAADLHTDRTNLYRKLMMLTSQKPSEFIRTIRLKHAAQLLQSSNYSIAEIADLCGFSTPSYFTNSFKKMFGMTPGEYQRNNKS